MSRRPGARGRARPEPPARGVCVAVEARERVCLGELWWEPYSSSEVDVQSEPCCRRRVSRVSELVPEARTEQSSTQHPRAPPGLRARARSGRVSRAAAGAPAPRSPSAEAPADPRRLRGMSLDGQLGASKGPCRAAQGGGRSALGRAVFCLGVALCPLDGNGSRGSLVVEKCCPQTAWVRGSLSR